MTEALVVDRLQHQVDRVRDHSPQHVNRRIARNIDISVQHCIREGREAIIERLGEIDREWDIDRVLMANFAIAGGITYMLGLHRFIDRPSVGSRRAGWLYLLGAQFGFLFLHASIGWCPPVVIWRRMGVRTKSEIELERSLLLGALEPPLPKTPQLTAEAKPARERESLPPKSSQVVS